MISNRPINEPVQINLFYFKKTGSFNGFCTCTTWEKVYKLFLVTMVNMVICNFGFYSNITKVMEKLGCCLFQPANRWFAHGLLVWIIFFSTLTSFPSQAEMKININKRTAHISFFCRILKNWLWSIQNFDPEAGHHIMILSS